MVHHPALLYIIQMSLSFKVDMVQPSLLKWCNLPQPYLYFFSPQSLNDNTSPWHLVVINPSADTRAAASGASCTASFLLCAAAGQGYRVLREAINLTQPLHLGLLLLPLCIHAIFSPSVTCFAFSSSLYRTEVCFVVTSLHYWEPQGWMYAVFILVQIRTALIF